MSKVSNTKSSALPVKRRSEERISNPEERDAKVRRLSADTGKFAQIDEHVKNTPNSATQSMKSLAEYLASGANSDLEKIRAIYMWVTGNIRYDTDGLKGTKPTQPCDSESVLKNRVCVCEGYAMMVRNLCRLMNIECRRIYGFSKGSTYNALEPLPLEKGCDHVWNVVKLDGAWRFIEATWGAGRVQRCGKVLKDATECYFLTDPEVFIQEHFPYEKKDVEGCKQWQLLENPIDLDTFHKQARRTPACFQHQVELLSHDQAVIDVEDNEIVLKFRGSRNPLNSLTADFVNPKTGERIKSGRYVASVLDHRTNEATIIARPPTTTAAYLELELFGTADISQTKHLLVSYQIMAKDHSTSPIFPDNKFHYGLHIYEDSLCYTDNLKGFAAENEFWLKVEGGTHELMIPLEKTMNTEVCLNFGDHEKPVKRACIVEVGNKFVRICLRLREVGFYALNLYCGADEPDDEASEDTPVVSYKPVASFLVQCLSCDPDMPPFPDIDEFFGVVHDPLKFGFTEGFRDQSFILQADAGECKLMLPTSQPVVSDPEFLNSDEEDFGRFCLVENIDGFLRISLRMHQVGFYHLKLFCKVLGATSTSSPLMANFLIECPEALEEARPFPSNTPFAMTKMVTLESPRDGDLPANSTVQFKLSSQAVSELMVNNKMYKKSGEIFDFALNTGAAGRELKIFGATKSGAKLYNDLYTFNVIRAD